MNEENDRGMKKEKIFDKIKELRKNKKGRAKIELSLYLIFFVGVIIFARVLNHQSSNYTQNSSEQINSFIYIIKDNYQYDLKIIKNDDEYIYTGKVLGNNSSIKLNNGTEEKYFYVMNDKYYELDSNGNYILTTKDEVYPYINDNYLNINLIKNLINNSVKEDNLYKVKISDIILNNSSQEYITIDVKEEENALVIDYTNLFKIDDENINKLIITIAYNNIDNLTSLEE